MSDDFIRDGSGKVIGNRGGGESAGPADNAINLGKEKGAIAALDGAATSGTMRLLILPTVPPIGFGNPMKGMGLQGIAASITPPKPNQAVDGKGGRG